MSVSGSVLLLQRDIVTKETYAFNWGLLMVSEGSSVIVVVEHAGSIAAACKALEYSIFPPEYQLRECPAPRMSQSRGSGLSCMNYWPHIDCWSQDWVSDELLSPMPPGDINIPVFSSQPPTSRPPSREIDYTAYPW